MGTRCVSIVILTWAVVLTSCSGGSERSAGWRVEGLAADFAAVLEHCAAISEGALPRRCRRAREQIDGCSRVEGSCAGEGCDLLATLQCSEGALSVAAVDSGAADASGAREGAGFAIAGSLADGSELVLEGQWTHDQSGRDLRLSLVGESLEGTWSRWLPSGLRDSDLRASEPGASLDDAWLDGWGSFLHLRWRPRGGLALSSPDLTGGARGMADRLYGLGSQLFSRAVLEGTAELVFYPPVEGGEFPGVGLAVEVRSAQVARTAVEAYLEQMAGRWSFERVPYGYRGLQGSCILELRVLPELAPCFVLSDRALFLGWNRRVLERALGDGAPAESGGEVSGRWLRADFEQWALADRRIAASRELAVGVHLPFVSAVAGPVEADGVDLALEVLLMGSKLLETRAGEGLQP